MSVAVDRIRAIDYTIRGLEAEIVFTKKQPPQAPRPRMNARQISKSTGIAVDEVMATVSDLGEYVKTPASMLEEPVVRRVYDALHLRYVSDKPRPTPPWDWKGRSDQSPTPVAKRGGSREGDRSEWHSSATNDWWQTQTDVAPAWDVESWKIYNFSEAERDAWIAHGLRPGQVKDANTYRDAGIMPGDLVQVVEGWTVLKRLRSGEPACGVLRLLGRALGDEEAV